MDNTFSLTRGLTVPLSYGIGATNQAMRAITGSYWRGLIWSDSEVWDDSELLGGVFVRPDSE